MSRPVDSDRSTVRCTGCGETRRQDVIDCPTCDVPRGHVQGGRGGLGRALQNAAVVDGALAPALTVWDKRVLAAVPAAPAYDPDTGRDAAPYPAWAGLDPWIIARAVRATDVELVRMTLRGLWDRKLVFPIGFDTQRRLQRWIRTADASTTKEATE